MVSIFLIITSVQKEKGKKSQKSVCKWIHTCQTSVVQGSIVLAFRFHETLLPDHILKHQDKEAILGTAQLLHSPVTTYQ